MFGFVNKLAGRRRLSLAAVCGGSREFHMSTNPSEQSTAQPQSGGGPVDRPNGSIDDDSVHPLTDPDDDTTGNIEPVVPLGNAETENESNPDRATRPSQDARLMGPAGN